MDKTIKLSIGICMVVILCSMVYGEFNCDLDNVIYCYHFDESLTDENQLSHMECTGDGCESYRDGYYDQGIYINNSVYTIPYNVSGTTLDFTVEMWVKMNGTPSDGGVRQGFFTDLRHKDTAFGMRGWYRTDTKLWEYQEQDGNQKQTNTITISDNQWHFYAFAMDTGSTSLHVYIDGILNKTLNVDADVAGTDPIYIGRGDPSTYIGNITIDELVFFNNTRSAALILSDYRGVNSSSDVLDNCSTYTDVMYNVSFYDYEDNNQSLIYEYTIDYTSELGNNSYSDTGQRDFFSICLNDTSINVTADIHIDYFNSTEFYTFQVEDLVLGVTQKDQSLYVTHDPTSVTFSVVDQEDEEVSNAYIKIFMYDVGEDTYKQTEQLQTDNDGEAVGNIILNDVWYKFQVEYGGVIVYTEPQRKITSTSVEFRIPVDPLVIHNIVGLYNLDITLTVDKNPRQWEVTWSGITDTLDEIGLEIYKVNTTTNTLIDSFTSSANSGSHNYSLASVWNTSGTYVGNVYGVYTVTGDRYIIDSKSVDIREEYDMFGTDALIMSFLFVGTMACIGIAVDASFGLLLTILGMVLFWVLGFYEVLLTGLIGLIINMVIVMVRLKRR